MIATNEYWEKISFDDAFEQISTSGKTVKTAGLPSEGRYPVIDQGQAHCAGFLDSPELVISSGSPVIIFGDHTRAVKWVAAPFIPGADGVKVLASRKPLDARFFYYQLRNLRLERKGYARHFSQVRDAAYCLPPLAEQKRIAQELEALLVQVDTLKARIDAIPALLKRFRQSVLASATSGALTKDWREGNPHPKAPRSTDLAQASEAWDWKEVPNSWRVEAYSQVVESRLGKMLDKAKNSGVPTMYLGNINVRWHHFDLKKLQEILVSDQELKELELQPGDVLICEGGEPGRSAVWNSAARGIVYQKALHRARMVGELLPEMLVLNLKNDADRKSLSQLFTGSTIKHLTGSALKDYPLRLPPLVEQTEIVSRVEQLFAFADQLEAKVTSAKQRIDTLTQSILAKAFRGELVPQDPNDEPASVLLERLRADTCKTRSKRTKKSSARS